MPAAHLTSPGILSLLTVFIVYAFLIAERINKVVVVMLGAAVLIYLQIFKTVDMSSQTGALSFVKNNIDVLGFIIGMMVLVGIVKESGLFESLAIRLVKAVKGNPRWLLIVFGYLSLVMTALLSNIPTVLILTPVLIVLIRELKLPFLPYFFVMITMANIGGAMTPISDPTTYYQAKTVGLGFVEVVQNSGVIVWILSMVVMAYSLLVFNSQLKAVKVKASDLERFNPNLALKNKQILWYGVPLLGVTILLMVTHEFITAATGITLDNATLSFTGAFIAIILFKKDMHEVFTKLIDWEIIFFFMGLFMIIGGLEHTGVITLMADKLVALTEGSLAKLLFFVSVGSGAISTFIDNVPYNIAMVSAIQAMGKTGINIYPLWWALNLGTSLGGAGSPIGAACNVVALGQAEREKFHVVFLKYLAYGFPLVIINGLVTFAVLYWWYIA